MDRAALVDEALKLLAADGLAGLNMRALANRFGVRASALYWHIHNKDELVGLVAAGIYERSFASVQAQDWREWLVAFGHALRREVMTHRDAARICAVTAPAQAFAAENLERLAGPLRDACLSTATSLSYQSSVISLTLGWALFEQRDLTRTFLSQALDFDESFTIGLKALVAGLPEPARRPPSS